MVELRANMVRVDPVFGTTLFKAKIADAEQWRVHPAVGGTGHPPPLRHGAASSAVTIPLNGTGVLSVRLHHGGPQGRGRRGNTAQAKLPECGAGGMQCGAGWPCDGFKSTRDAMMVISPTSDLTECRAGLGLISKFCAD